MCWTIIEWLIIGQTPEAMIYIFGHMPLNLCLLHAIIKKAIVTQVLLMLDAIIIGRYILIFWLKNPAAFNDDFWSRFVRWVNTVIFLVTFKFKLCYIYRQSPILLSVTKSLF